MNKNIKKLKSNPSSVRVELYSLKTDIPTKLDLHGYNIEDAINRLDKYLDTAYLHGIRQTRLVHGHGTGKLRKALRNHLANHPHVRRYHPADTLSGGDGVTIIYLEIN